jgi:hypothetical protein
MKRYKSLLIMIAICAMPFFADACPLCQAGATKRSQKAYNQTIILLACMPLVSGGGIFFWLYSKKKHEDEDNN